MTGFDEGGGGGSDPRGSASFSFAPRPVSDQLQPSPPPAFLEDATCDAACRAAALHTHPQTHESLGPLLEALAATEAIRSHHRQPNSWCREFGSSFSIVVCVCVCRCVLILCIMQRYSALGGLPGYEG